MVVKMCAKTLMVVSVVHVPTDLDIDWDLMVYTAMVSIFVVYDATYT